jgi:hypothetical protein
VNSILPTIQNRSARLSKSRPKYQVKPNSNDESDKNAARLGEQVLEMIWQKEDMDIKAQERLMALQQAGHCYDKVSWDSQLGERIVDPKTGESEYEGDVRVDIISAFEVFPDPMAKSDRDLNYLIHAKIRKLDYFRERYEKGHLVQAEDTWLISLQYEHRLNTMNNKSAGSNPQSFVKDCAIELAYYEKRSKKHPNGRMIIAANGIILEDKELPIGEIPFIKYDDIIIHGKYYSEAIITHLRPIQDQKNRLIRKRSQWVNKLLTGKLIAARGAEIAQESLNDQSGEVFYYTTVPNAAPPEAMPMPVIPQYAYLEEDKLDGMLNDVSGINEVSRGQSPGSGITAGIALAYLSEQDDTRVGFISRRINANHSLMFFP